MNGSKLDELVEGIHHLFPDAKCHGRTVLRSPDTGMVIENYLKGRSWLDVDRDFVEEFDGALSLATDEAFRCFLPAWLRWCVPEPEGTAAWVLLGELEVDRDLSQFSEAQRQLVCEIAEYLVDAGALGRSEVKGERDELLLHINRLWGGTIRKTAHPAQLQL